MNRLGCLPCNWLDVCASWPQTTGGSFCTRKDGFGIQAGEAVVAVGSREGRGRR